MLVKHDSVNPIDFGGLRIVDYTANLASSSSFATICVPAGASHVESWSKRSDKYYYVVAGEVEFTVDGQSHVLSAGDFCSVPQGQHFSYRNRGSHEAQLCLVHTPSFDLSAEEFIE